MYPNIICFVNHRFHLLHTNLAAIQRAHIVWEEEKREAFCDSYTIYDLKNHSVKLYCENCYSVKYSLTTIFMTSEKGNKSFRDNRERRFIFEKKKNWIVFYLYVLRWSDKLISDNHWIHNRKCTTSPYFGEAS